MPIHCTDEARLSATVTGVLRRHGARREALVQILREVQEHTRWLPHSVLERVAAGVGLQRRAGVVPTRSAARRGLGPD